MIQIEHLQYSRGQIFEINIRFQKKMNKKKPKFLSLPGMCLVISSRMFLDKKPLKQRQLKLNRQTIDLEVNHVVRPGKNINNSIR